MRKEQIQKVIDNCSLPDQCESADLIETHISWVILTEKFAFKIKKPIRLSFLDYSTLQKRSHFCKEELDLNRRLAPDVYLQVLPITAGMAGSDGDKDPGRIVEYAVQMKKLDRRKEMHRLLEKKEVLTSHLDKLAGKLARFHKNARIIKNVFNTTGFQEKFEDILTVMDDLVTMLGKEWEERIRECVNRSNSYLNASRSLLNQRIITNYRRDCHGDLNATNIFLYEDPIIFDCIEFNKEFRHIDVLNEIAFLCVDLDFYGNPGLSDYFYHSYLESYDMEEDDNLRNMWNYYKSYRANVRAKVTAINARQGDEDARQAHDIKKYLRLMEKYTRSYS